MGYIILLIILIFGIMISKAVFKKLQIKTKLPINVPIRHRLLLRRKIVQIINPTLFLVREKRIFNWRKFIPFLRHKASEYNEYLIQPAYVVNYDLQRAKFTKNQQKNDFHNILLDPKNKIYTKCIGVDELMVDGKLQEIEIHNIYFILKTDVFLSDYIAECVKKGLLEAVEPTGFATRGYYNLMKEYEERNKF